MFMLFFCKFSEIFQGSKRLLFSWFLWTYRRFCLHWEVLQGHPFSRHLLKKLKHHKFLTVCVTFGNILICLFTFFWDCRNVLRQSAFWAFFQDTREARIMSLMPCSSINLNPCIYWIGNHFLKKWIIYRMQSLTISLKLDFTQKVSNFPGWAI